MCKQGKYFKWLATASYHAIIILPIYTLASDVYLMFKDLCPKIKLKGVGILKTIINIKTKEYYSNFPLVPSLLELLWNTIVVSLPFLQRTCISVSYFTLRMKSGSVIFRLYRKKI